MAKSLLRTDKEIADIYFRQVKTIYRVCFAYMKTTHDTEDAVHDTFIKMMKQDGKLTTEDISKILSEEKKPPKGEPTGDARYRRFFPPSYSPKQIDEVFEIALSVMLSLSA